jgi:hypothetical protein
MATKKRGGGLRQKMRCKRGHAYHSFGQYMPERSCKLCKRMTDRRRRVSWAKAAGMRALLREGLMLEPTNETAIVQWQRRVFALVDDITAGRAA